MKSNTHLTIALLVIGSLAFTSDAFADHTRTVRRVYESNRIDLEHDFKTRRKANTYAYHRERDALRADRTRAIRIDCPETRSRRVRAINYELTSLLRDYNLRNREITSWYHDSRKALRADYDLALRDARRSASRPVVVETVSTVHAGHPVDCTCNVCVPVEPIVVERPVIYEPVVVERRPAFYEPVVVERPLDRYGRTTTFAHPADCDCHICEPPAPVIETCPNSTPRFGTPYGDRYDLRDRDLRSSYRVDRDGRSEFSDGYGRDYGPATYRRPSNSVDWASLILNLVK